jgi:hypothetical protein
MFRLANTFNAATPAGVQQGFPPPGAGAQTTGPPLVPQHAGATEWAPERPTKGKRTFFKPGGPTGGQQGFAPVENEAQRRPPGSMPNAPPIYGMPIFTETPYYDRGAAAFVPNFGKVLFNPIGAGIVALQRPQASYGGAAQYFDGMLFWTSQVIPTSINLQGLTDPEEMAAILNGIDIQAVMRTTG